MNKDILIKIPSLIVYPRRYFNDVIDSNSFKLKDVVWLGLGIVVIFTILHIFQYNIFDYFKDMLSSGIYLGAFMLGIAVSFAFKTYFITTALQKTGVDVNYRKAGMVVCTAMIPGMVLLFLSLVFQAKEYYDQVDIVIRLWNYLLLVIGISVISGVRWTKIALLILVMYGYMLMIEFAFAGMF